jgi:hypothetical protein
VMPIGGGGLLSRLRRAPGFSLGGTAEMPLALGASLPGDVISALEARSLWSRFGL